jgi:Phosphomannomutase
MWWFNVRASNTEPLLRVNIEAATEQTLQEIVARVDAHIPGA